MFWSPFFYRSTTDSNGNQKNIRWLSVNWPIFAWHSGNYIYMYANWTSADDENRSYEILWENELAVGTRWWAFIYFTQRTGTFDNITGWEYPWVIHERSGIINTVWCNPITPPANTPQWWRWIWWWNISPQSQCTIQNLTWHNYHGVSAWELMVDEWDAYNSLMVWVNTNAPQATLDVNGTIRVWSNCVTALWTICTWDNVWTMMYVENETDWYLIMCMKQDGQYKRYDIMSGTGKENLLFGSLVSTDFKCYLPKPTPWVYPGFTGQVTENNPILEY